MAIKKYFSSKDIPSKEQVKLLNKLSQKISTKNYGSEKIHNLITLIGKNFSNTKLIQDYYHFYSTDNTTYQDPSPSDLYQITGVKPRTEFTDKEFVRLIETWRPKEEIIKILERVPKIYGRGPSEKAIQQIKDVLQEIPMDVVFGSIFFLYSLGLDLSKAMMDYLEDNQMDNLMEQQIFQENMDGIKASSLHSLKTMLDELKISLN